MEKEKRANDPPGGKLELDYANDRNPDLVPLEDFEKFLEIGVVEGPEGVALAFNSERERDSAKDRLYKLFTSHRMQSFLIKLFVDVGPCLGDEWNTVLGNEGPEEDFCRVKLLFTWSNMGYVLWMVYNYKVNYKQWGLIKAYEDSGVKDHGLKEEAVLWDMKGGGPEVKKAAYKALDVFIWNLKYCIKRWGEETDLFSEVEGNAKRNKWMMKIWAAACHKRAEENAKKEAEKALEDEKKAEEGNKAASARKKKRESAGLYSTLVASSQTDDEEEG